MEENTENIKDLKLEESVNEPPHVYEPETVSGLRKLAITLERMKFSEYVSYMNNTKRLIGMNLVAGIFRGLGLTLGATVLVAAILFILGKMVDIPLIGEWIGIIVLNAQAQIDKIK